MLSALEFLRPFGFGTTLLRLLIALVAGCAIGYGRAKKERPAGMRTYTLVAVGSALAAIVTLYLYEMIRTSMMPAPDGGLKFDASRIASQTISGIGFLCAGIIFKIAHAQFNGLTSATGLFATVCLGMAAGFGFYELAVLLALIIIVVLNVMSPLEGSFKRRLRNITVCVELNDIRDINAVSNLLDGMEAHVYDIEIERAEADEEGYPTAVFIVRLPKKNHSHSGLLTSIAGLTGVVSVQELIS